MNNNLIKKLEKRVDNKIKLKPIFKGGDDEILLKKFLNKQNYLNPKNIFSIIEINFLKNSPIGYALYKSESEIVGFLGTIFSERKVQHSLSNHCYLHSWIVDENYFLQSKSLQGKYKRKRNGKILLLVYKANSIIFNSSI